MTVSKFISLTRKKWKKYSIIFTNHGHTLHKPLWHKNKARSFLRGPKWNEKASSGVPASYNCDRIGCEFLIFAASSSTCSNWVPESLSIPRYFYCHFIFLLFVQFISVLSNYRIFIFLCLIFVLLTHFTFILFIHPIFFFFFHLIFLLLLHPISLWSLNAPSWRHINPATALEELSSDSKAME